VIQGQGVTPERVVALDPRLVGRGDRDVQLKEAVEYLRGH